MGPTRLGNDLSIRDELRNMLDRTQPTRGVIRGKLVMPPPEIRGIQGCSRHVNSLTTRGL